MEHVEGESALLGQVEVKTELTGQVEVKTELTDSSSHLPATLMKTFPTFSAPKSKSSSQVSTKEDKLSSDKQDENETAAKKKNLKRAMVSEGEVPFKKVKKQLQTKKNPPRPLKDEEYEEIFAAVLERVEREATAATAHDDFEALLSEPVEDICKVTEGVENMKIMPESCVEVKSEDVSGDQAYGVRINDAAHALPPAIERPLFEEDVDIDHLPNDLRAHITQVVNEVTPFASDEDEFHAVSCHTPAPSPPKVPKKRGSSTKKKKMTPKQLAYSAEQIRPGPQNKAKPSTSSKLHVIDKMVDKSIFQLPKQNKRRPKKISKKKKILDRPIEETGTWVQCCNTDCKKWRYLSDVHDPSSLPEIWLCEMNSDAKFNRCSILEQEFDQDEHDSDYVFTKYTEGSLVWAKMPGYPWWPAMVDIDPDTEAFFECRGKQNEATDYHVVFLDDKVSRAWIRVANLRPFTGKEKPENLGPTKFKSHNYSKAITVAMANGIEALDMSLKTRILTYSFGTRFNGKWAIVISDDEEDSAPEILTVSRKKRNSKRKQTGAVEEDLSEVLGLGDTEVDAILASADIALENAREVLDSLMNQNSQGSEYVPEKKEKQKMKRTNENKSKGQKAVGGKVSGKKRGSKVKQRTTGEGKSGKVKSKTTLAINPAVPKFKKPGIQKNGSNKCVESNPLVVKEEPTADDVAQVRRVLNFHPDVFTQGDNSQSDRTCLESSERDMEGSMDALDAPSQSDVDYDNQEKDGNICKELKGNRTMNQSKDVGKCKRKFVAPKMKLVQDKNKEQEKATLHPSNVQSLEGLGGGKAKFLEEEQDMFLNLEDSIPEVHNVEAKVPDVSITQALFETTDVCLGDSDGSQPFEADDEAVVPKNNPQTIPSEIAPSDTDSDPMDLFEE